jgi:hypothetical protein
MDDTPGFVNGALSGNPYLLFTELSYAAPESIQFLR